MRLSKHLPVVLLPATVLAALLLTSCGTDVHSADEQELDSPMMKQALDRESEGDNDAALALYSKVLDSDPRLARAHLNMAFLLDDQKKDYVGAIYHYQRYIELRPTTGKREMIENRIRMAKMEFAASMFHQPPDLQKEIETLRQQNAALKASIVKLQQQAAERSEELSRVARERAQSTPALPVAETPKKPRYYRVRRGDTLSSIAAEIYQDEGHWQQIYQANRDKLENSNGIKVGQMLLLP